MANKWQRLSLLPFLALSGQVACSSGVDAHSPIPNAQGPASSSGSSGGTGASSGGDVPVGGNDAGVSPSGSSGSSGSGSASGSGSGAAGSGGSSGVTGASSSSSSGGPGPADGGGGSSSGAPPPPPASDGGVPAGYPAPTAANYAKCQTVPIGATACAGTAAGNVCIECLFGGSTYNSSETTPDALGTSEAGNYIVTVQLGGAAAGQTTVSAESTRGLLAPVSTAPGQTAEYAFVVNARAMEGQPNHAGGPGGYPGLDLFFSGPAATPPQVSAIGYALATPATKPVMIYIASDSTTCDQTGGAYGGWGQMLPQFFAPPIGVANYANSGASSSSFFGAADLWGAITSRWTAGDYVIVQFGHNDKSVPDATVQANLEKYLVQAKAANVTAIVVSPPARVQFVGNVDGDQSGLHPAAARAAAAAQGVAYIDLTGLSTAWYNMLGSSAAALKFHANGTDGTHTNLEGAAKLAALVAGDIKAQNLPLAKYLRP